MSEIKIQRFNIEVDDNWKVIIREEGGGAALIGERQMQQHPDGAEGMIPGPPEQEIPEDQGDLRQICLGDPATFWKTFHAVTIKRTPPGITLGQYLFECLLGKANWDAVLAAGDPEATIELALTWDKSATALHRLNWELMHDGDHFLVAQPQRRVAVTRRITGVPDLPEETTLNLSLPPRLLFVTGVPLHDVEIRPAAEYLGLLGEFQDSKRSVNSYLLEDAKHSDLVQALEDFKPDVVYFVCHGYFDEHGSYLRLKNDKGIEQNFYADDLGQILQVEGVRPKLVVLSACYSAGMPHYRVIPEAFESDQENAKPQPGEILGPGIAGPMAAVLIEHGVPVVIGMAGRVTDTACRLFTRRFAESLIKGEPLVYSTAQGRKAAHVEGDYWKASVDWGFPTIFMASDVPQTYAPVNTSKTDKACVIKTRIERYPIPEYPRFFGRNEIIRLYYSLFKDDGPKIILARVPEGASGYGKTRLLQELTRRSLLDGNIPLPLIIEPSIIPPKTPIKLALAILKQIYHTRAVFGSDIPPLPDSMLLKRLLFVLPEPKKSDFSSLKEDDYSFYKNEIIKYLDNLKEEEEPEISPDSIIQALIEDIKELVKDAEADPITKEGKGFPIILLDHVHEYDAALEALLGLESTSRWLGNYGLGDDKFPIPVVLTYEDNQAFRIFLEKTTKLNRARLVEIQPFNQVNDEDMLAYNRFLLYPDVNETIPELKDPLVANPNVNPAVADTIRDVIRMFVGGIPRNMVESNGKSTFALARKREVFKPANDADFIERNKEDL